MNTSPVIILDHVNKIFHTRHFLSKDEETGVRRFVSKKTVQAAREICFDVFPGEIFGLLGPNGAGKTTTVKMLSGLVRPTSGKVFVDGIYVEKKRLKALRRIGVVLEGTRTSIWPLTPLENLAYYGNLKDVKGTVLRKRSRELLSFIGLKDKMDVQVRKLSRGEKQKLAICIALIADPPVLLLDEPTTGLDVQSARMIKDKVVEMARNQGKCVLVTTHDMHVAEELCDRIGIINKGELITCKTTAQLLEVFSEQVYTLRLDRLPASNEFEGIPGISAVEPIVSDDGPMCLVHFEQEPAIRSAALYAVIERLNQNGFILHGISQRQQNLEDVFLSLTGAGSRGVSPTPMRTA